MKKVWMMLFTILLLSNCNKEDHVDRVFSVSNSRENAFIFKYNTIQNPIIELIRGNTYVFEVNSPGYGFLIKTYHTKEKYIRYDDGVTNNGTSNGILVFTVPHNAPDALFYVCESHDSLVGILSIIG